MQQRFGLIVGMAFAVALGGWSCSRTADEREQAQEAAVAARDGAAGEEIKVTGCLTSAADRGAYVVTADPSTLTSGALHAGSGETPTYSYELTGNTDALAAHVGQQVEVVGRLDDDRSDEVKVDDERKQEEPARRSGNEEVRPTIETDTEMEINVRRLEVSSVQATGQRCQQ